MNRVLIGISLSALAIAAAALPPGPATEAPAPLADKCVVSGPLSYGGTVVYPGGTYCVPFPG